MKSKLLAIFIATVFTLTMFPLLVSAQSDITVAIDNTPVIFPNIGPQIVEDRTLVPVRGVFEALGFEVDWYAPEQRVILTRDDYIIVFTIGSAYFTTNDITHTLGVPAQIIADSTFLPLRSPLESVGYYVGWNVNIRTVLISTAGEPPLTQVYTPDEPQAPTAEELEARVFELTNMERINRGIAPLAWNPSLAQAARLHSEDMSENGFMCHMGSDDSSPMDRMERVGFRFMRAAENVAFGQRTPEQVIEAWMDSDGHRRNILDPNLTEIGVGFYDYSWTQKFGTPR